VFGAARTMRGTIKLQGTFQLQSTGVGTHDFGFILFAPYSALSNDLTCIYKTTDTSTATAITNSGSVGLSTVIASTGPRANATFDTSTGNRRRLIAAGLRIMYGGTELNRGGVIAGMMEPNHESLGSAGLTYDTLCSNYREVKSNPVRKGFRQVKWSPIQIEEMQLLDNTTVLTLAPHIRNSNMVLAVRGPGVDSGTSVPQSYRWEAIVHYEFAGPSFNNSAIPAAFPDPAGAQAMLMASTNYEATTEGEEAKHESWEIGEMASNLFYGVSGAARALMIANPRLVRAVASEGMARASRYLSGPRVRRINN